MENKVIEQLRKISPAGKNGFEGLVSKLLEHLTGKHFYLARSGSQAGRDMRSDRHGGNIIAVECKRYGEKKELNERELLAGLVQASNDIPDLDLWVLVVSRDIPDQLLTLLDQQAVLQGIEFRALSTGDGSPSTLEALCAHGIQIVLDLITSIPSKQNVQQIQYELEKIAKSSGFESTIERLQRSFTAARIGYEHWRVKQNEWLMQRFSTESGSRSSFGQELHVGSKEANLVKRNKIWKELNEWLSSWSKKPSLFALLGDEGDGKTWAVASWLNWQILNTEDFPSVIFLSSSHPQSPEPASLLSEAISRQIGTQQDRTYWEKRLRRWLQRPIGQTPAILLVLDGINERRTPEWWRGFIEGITSSPWLEHIAVLITARKGYWERYFSILRYLSVHDGILPPYDDTELNAALKQHQLTRADIADNLLPLIRKPRYLDLVVKHRRRMAESGDITVARLIYEDWRDRWERKTNTPIDDQQFKTLIKRLAEKAIQGINKISEKDIVDQLPLINDKQGVFDELVSGGILYGISGSFRVDEQRLTLGFALLLVDQIESAHIDLDHDSSLDEKIAFWMEPHQEMDIKAAIFESAALHALSLGDKYPQHCRVALLNAWLESKNLQEEIEQTFAAYLPMYPSAYLKLAEIIWSDTHDNPWGQDLLMKALLRWRNAPSVQSILPKVFERWLGFIHPDGHPFQRRENKREDIEKVRRKIAERVKQELLPGPFEFAGYPLTVIKDDGLLRLGRASLAIISHLPRKPYLRAIVIGCISEAICDFPDKYELFAWVLRSSPETLWPETEKYGMSLLDYDDIVSKQAAYRLLSFEGSEQAVKMQKTLPEDLFPPNLLLKMHRRDPCKSIFTWSQAECETCLQRTDLAPSWIARKIQPFCHNPKFPVPTNLGAFFAPLADQIPVEKIWSGISLTAEAHLLEEIEPALCAFAPETAAKIYRSIAKTVDNRKGIALRQLAMQITKHELILDDEAKECLQTAWHRLVEQTEAVHKGEELAEEFLFHVVLLDADSELQLAYLLKRPLDAKDLISFAHFFKTIGDWRYVLKKLAEGNACDIRRILWFLAVCPQKIPESVLSTLVTLMEHNDSLVRRRVLQILYAQRNKKNIGEFVKGHWAWDLDYTEEENYWGSLLLARYAKNIAYAELRSRVHPSHLGFALVQRSGMEDEVNQYAEDIQRIWKILETGTSDIPSDFPATEVRYDLAMGGIKFDSIGLSDTLFSKSVRFASRDAFWGGMTGAINQESFADALEPGSNDQLKILGKIVRETIEQQTEAGNIWFARSFSIHALDLVMRHRPDLVDTWLEGISEKDLSSEKLLIKGRSFYESLCRMLLSKDPSRGLNLYYRLCEVPPAINFVIRGTGIPVLRYALFEAPDVPEIINAWDQCLQQCKTDEELLDLVIVAQTGKGLNWLESKVEQDLESTVMFSQSRAMLIRGLLAAKDTGEWLASQTKPQVETWFDRVVEKACLYWQSDTWAKYWFERFLSIPNDTHAWAAFRLLLKCVDRRFWIWQNELRTTVPCCGDVQRRFAFLNYNKDTLRDSIKKNEKSMAENFLATKVLDNQAWPWMRVDV